MASKLMAGCQEHRFLPLSAWHGIEPFESTGIDDWGRSCGPGDLATVIATMYTEHAVIGDAYDQSVI